MFTIDKHIESDPQKISIFKIIFCDIYTYPLSPYIFLQAISIFDFIKYEQIYE